MRLVSILRMQKRKLEQPLPSVEMMKTAITNLDKSITDVKREQPKLRSFISDLEQEREKKQETLLLILRYNNFL